MIKGNSFDLLYQLVRTNFKLKYNDSVLGFLWVLLKPFLLFMVLYVVFSQVARGQASENFQIYLLMGVICYNYFTESIVSGMNSLLDKAHIILKVNFNRKIAVYSGQILAVINLLINLIILAVFSIFNDIHVDIRTLSYFFFILLTFTCLTLGISFFTSIIFVRFRDLLHITEIGLQILFYASAIFFPIDQVPEKMGFLFLDEIPVREIMQLNPVYILIQSGRDAFIKEDVTHLKEVLTIFSVSIALIVIGRYYFTQKVKRIAEYF